MKNLNKIIYHIIIIAFISGIFLIFISCHPKKEKLSLTPDPALSADQINDEDFIEQLLKLNKEERAGVIKENKDKITSPFINQVLLKANDCCNDVESIEPAKNLINLSLELSLFTGDRISEGKSLVFSSIIELLENKDRTFPSLEKALSLFKEKGDKKGEAACYVFKGLFTIKNSYKDGMDTLDRGLKIYEDINAEKDLADSMLIIAGEFSKHGEKEKSIEYYERALKIYEENDYLLKKAITYKLIAATMSGMGITEKALQQLENAENIIKSITDEEIEKEKSKRDIYYPNKAEMNNYYDREFLLIENYRDQGSLYKRTGQYEKSLKIYQEELSLARKKGNKGKEIMALWDTGGIYDKLGKKEKAVEYFQKSLEINSEDMNYTIKSVNYYLLGLYYLGALDDLNNCLKYIQTGIEYTEKIDLKILKDLLKNVGIKLTGEAYLSKDKVDLAEENFNKCLKVFEEAQKNFGDQEVHITEIYTGLGEISLKKKDFTKALGYFEKAMKLTEDYYMLRIRANVYEHMGELYEIQEDYPLAIENYKKSLKINQMINLPDNIWKNLFYTGKIYEKQGNQKEAFKCFKSSIDIIENMRRDIKVEDFKRDFMKDKIKVYEKMIELLIEMKNYKEAFNYSERARNRAFLDILSNQKIDFHKGAPQALIDKEEELTEKIQKLNYQLGSERQKPDKNQDKILIEKMTSDLEKNKKDYEDLLAQLKLESPEYASTISVYPEKIENIQKLLDDDSIILEYFIGKEKTFLWLLDKDNIQVIILPLKADNLNKKVKDYREEIASHMTIEKIKSDKWKEKAEEFYRLLLKDGEKIIRDKKQLIIVPDGILNYLPFQTLVDNKDKCLVEKFNILYLPSGSLLRYCKEKNNLSNNSLVAFAPGNLSIAGYSPLPYSKEEVINISKFYKKNEIYSEQNMTLEKVYKNSNKGDILHFATHSILDTEAPLFSSLVLADGNLEVYKIFDLDLSAYLVTLSACSTGLGELVAGDELTGLSRAFIYAGTPSVCVSLWDVSDTSTSELMEKFYFYLKEGKTKSEALRLAELDTKRKYPHPFFWAPFILIGDWE
jgi:CHAT domain-containing protein/Tfp pilus assembly protein PilF